MNTTRHIDAMAHTARELEALGRRIGFYAKDCDTLDSALKRGKSGVVLLFDEVGEVAEIHPIGEQAQVKIEKGNAPGEWTASYEQMSGKEFDIAVARGHEVSKAAGPTPTQKLTGDALRNKQMMDAARERNIRADGVARNEAIAQRQKDFWAKRKSA